jgi:hypothetical protein
MVTAFLGLYFIGLTNSFGVVSHSQSPLLPCLFVLMLSPCGDGFSVDAWIRRKRRAGLPAQAPAADGRYRWPIQLTRAIWCAVFFSAGVFKLRESGSAWIFSDNLKTLFLLAPYRYPAAAAASLTPGLGAWLAQSGGLCMGLAFLTVSLEISAPLALLNTGCAWIQVLLLGSMQILAYFTLYENFVWFLPLYLAWLPFTARPLLDSRPK